MQQLVILQLILILFLWFNLNVRLNLIVNLKAKATSPVQNPRAQKSPVQNPRAQKSPVQNPRAQKSPDQNPRAQKSPDQDLKAQKNLALEVDRIAKAHARANVPEKPEGIDAKTGVVAVVLATTTVAAANQEGLNPRDQ